MAGRSRRGRSGGVTDSVPLVRGGVAGLAAYVVGFILTFALIRIDGDLERGDFLEQVGASSVDFAGWVFYNAHFVDISVSSDIPFLSGQDSGSLLSDSPTQLPEFVYYLVPIVVLILAGFAVARLSPVSSLADGAVAGATILLGYLPLTVVGTVLFAASEQVGGGSGGFQIESSVSVSVETGPAIILAGLVFPAVLGAIGGVIASQTQDNRRGGYR